MERKRIHILSDRFIKFDTGNVTVGGIQTYVKDLSEVADGLGFKVFVYDFDPKERVIELEHCTVIGKNFPDTKKGCDMMAKYVYETMPDKKDLVIYDSDDRISLTPVFENSIGLQHGISWDMPDEKRRSLVRSMFGCLIRDYKTLRRLSRVKLLVCVDYNFVNWYRTFIRNNRVNLKVIPNYTRIAPRFEKDAEHVNIIFARRLRKYRGTRVFTEAIKRIVKDYPDVKVYIYGSGPEGEWMHQQLDGYNQIKFDNFAVGESLEVHSDKHIAIVPTVGSEGTSLSLLEALSAQCAVVCSDVGGMTNIVLDGFNGKMVRAGNSEELFKGIKYLIENPLERERIALSGYESVKRSFSFERWKREWEDILNPYLK